MNVGMPILFMGVLVTAVFWLLLKHKLDCWSREKMWLVFFACTIIGGYLKWGWMESDVLSLVAPIVNAVAVFCLMKWSTGRGMMSTLATFGIYFCIALVGDFFAVAGLGWMGFDVIRTVEDFGSYGYMRGVLLSYSMQILLAWGYSRIMEKRCGKAHVSGTERVCAGGRVAETERACASERVSGTERAYAGGRVAEGEGSGGRDETVFLMTALLVQFLFLFWAVFLMNQPYSDGPTLRLWYFYLSMHIMFAAAVLVLVAKHLGNEERRQIKRQIAAAERRNQQVFRHYQELEQEYRKLHHLRHDFRNLLSTACGVAQSGDVQRAEQIFEDVRAMLDEVACDEKE